MVQRSLGGLGVDGDRWVSLHALGVVASGRVNSLAKWLVDAFDLHGRDVSDCGLHLSTR